MKRQFKTVAVTTATLAMTILGSVPAQACGGGGRARVSVHRSHYRAPAVYQPVCHTYRQPVYAHPPIIQHPPVIQQPVTIQRPVTIQQPVARQQTVVQQQFVQQRAGVQGQSVQGQGVAQRQTVPAPVTTAQSVNRGQRGVQPSAVAPNRTVAPNRQAVAAPVAQGQVKQVQATAPTAAPVTGTVNNAEASALQMLVSMSSNQAPAAVASQAASQIPQFTAAASQAVQSHVGTWQVNLPGSQSVQLVLNDDSSFTWTATKNGKSNQFDGQFRLESGRLTLVRSNDLQQMAGSWSGSTDSFTFKLDGATTSGLAFARS